jgi:hypothetical protein
MSEPILQFFKYQHLPEHLQTISKPFGEMAEWMVKTLPRNPERTTALRKLLEAKDCAVRATLYKESDPAKMTDQELDKALAKGTLNEQPSERF